MGEYSVDGPNIKFILEKCDHISPTDIKAFFAAYREAVIPTSFGSFKQQYNYNQPNRKSTSDLSLSAWLGSLPSSKFEAVTKLDQAGVTIFLPDKKSDILNWVCFSDSGKDAIKDFANMNRTT